MKLEGDERQVWIVRQQARIVGPAERRDEVQDRGSAQDALQLLQARVGFGGLVDADAEFQVLAEIGQELHVRPAQWIAGLRGHLLHFHGPTELADAVLGDDAVGFVAGLREAQGDPWHLRNLLRRPRLGPERQQVALSWQNLPPSRDPDAQSPNLIKIFPIKIIFRVGGAGFRVTSGAMHPGPSEWHP